MIGGVQMNEQMVKDIQSELNNVENACIFIDFDNLYYSMRNYAIDVTDKSYDVCHFLNTIYGKDKIRGFRAYADFEQVQVSLRKLQENRVQIRNVYGNNKDDKYRKNASDIELSIDAIEMTYRDKNIDTYVIVTSDSDMIPIMSRLKYKGKKVHLYYTSQNSSQTTHFESFCDFSCDLLKLYEIDLERATFDYWYDTVIRLITDWYQDKSNANKTLGFKWLKEDIINETQLTDSFCSDLINQMIDDKKIIRNNSNVTNGVYFTLPSLNKSVDN